MCCEAATYQNIKKYHRICKLLVLLHRLRYRWCGAEVVDAAGGGAVGGGPGPARLAGQATLLQVVSHLFAVWDLFIQNIRGSQNIFPISLLCSSAH